MLLEKIQKRTVVYWSVEVPTFQLGQALSKISSQNRDDGATGILEDVIVKNDLPLCKGSMTPYATPHVCSSSLHGDRGTTPEIPTKMRECFIFEVARPPGDL